MKYYFVLCLKLISFHILSLFLGLIFFSLLFSSPLFSNIDVFFYRGIVLAFIAAAITAFINIIFKIQKFRIFTVRDILLNITLVTSISIVFFTHVPVTADRSISIFVLGHMASNPDQSFTEKDIEDYFISRYVKDYGAFKKRFYEQQVTGTITKTPTGYKISERGKLLIKFYDLIADIFHVDKNLIYPDR